MSRKKVKLDPEDDMFYTKLLAYVSLEIERVIEFPLKIISQLGHAPPTIVIERPYKLSTHMVCFHYVIFLDELDLENLNEFIRSEVAFLHKSLDEWLNIQGIKYSDLS
jgi:hypothetical protein